MNTVIRKRRTARLRTLLTYLFPADAGAPVPPLRGYPVARRR